MRTDFERARRCRKLQRLLNSLQLRRSIELLRKLTRYLLFAVLAAYVGGFIALQIQHQDFLQEIIRIKARAAGGAPGGWPLAPESARACFWARVVGEKTA